MIKLNPTVLRWRCRRGLLELDLFLIPFMDSQFSQLSIEEQHVFAELLECTDPEIHEWLTERQQPQRAEFVALCEKIRHHAKTHRTTL